MYNFENQKEECNHTAQAWCAGWQSSPGSQGLDSGFWGLRSVAGASYLSPPSLLSFPDALLTNEGPPGCPALMAGDSCKEKPGLG